MQGWNAVIDDYIALGKDLRSRYDIEVAAKIGMDAGPLHKHCENAACSRLEGPGVEKMKCCSRCKRIFYCSTECQSTGWKHHKAQCEAKIHQSQRLPSQIVLQDIMVLVMADLASSMPNGN